MIFVVLAFGFAIISYTALIRYIFVGWSSIKEEVSPDSYEDLPSVTVIIAARNEAGCIKKCVDSILANDFPKYKFEIIVVDDQSTDNTAEIASSIDKEVVRVVTTAGRSGGKKAALEYGIGMAVYPVIITTDADSLVGNKWLGVHSKMHANEDIKMTTGLVLPEVDDTVLSRFQWMDFAATMACLMLLLGIVVGWLISPVVFWMAVVSLFIKMLVDFLFLSQLAAHFDNKKVMHSFFVCFFIYFGHILLSGWHALFPTPYVWKERHSS
ncbi:MAG: glycosyltransferase [Saprospiraceae bacterium]|nr:glycosyltransferase [Saprospiraceae bacterium]